MLYYEDGETLQLVVEASSLEGDSNRSDQWRIFKDVLFSGRADGKFPSKFLRLGALVILLQQLDLQFRQRSGKERKT